MRAFMSDRRTRHTAMFSLSGLSENQMCEREARAILAETEPRPANPCDTRYVRASLGTLRATNLGPESIGAALAESLAAFVAMEIS
jgi:hypothetical protein